MKTYEEMEVQLHVFFTPALDRGKWSGSRSSHCYSCETDPSSLLLLTRSHLDDMEMNDLFLLSGIETRCLRRTANVPTELSRSQDIANTNQILKRGNVCGTVVSLVRVGPVKLFSLRNELRSLIVSSRGSDGYLRNAFLISGARNRNLLTTEM